MSRVGARVMRERRAAAFGSPVIGSRADVGETIQRMLDRAREIEAEAEAEAREAERREAVEARRVADNAEALRLDVERERERRELRGALAVVAALGAAFAVACWIGGAW